MPNLRQAINAFTFLFFFGACSETPQSEVKDPFFPNIKTDRTVRLAGLKDRVEVLYDDQGVPHIYAANEADAMAVQGYSVARDRFFQMEFIRKAAAGRMSELLGKLDHDAALDNDLETRRIMMTERGTMVYDEMLSGLTDEEKVRIRAYVNGINAWIGDAKDERNGLKAPYQYEKNPFLSAQKISFYDTSPWTVADSFAIGRYQQWNLSGSLGDELNLGRLRISLPAEFLAETNRFEPADPTVSVDNFFTVNPPFTGLQALNNFAAPTPVESLAFARQLRDTLHGLRQPGRVYGAGMPGSNNWVVGPKLTTGNAMLANDPHLTIMNPPLFYHNHINTKRFGGGRWNAMGVTFAGIPGLLVGHNEGLAWGVTTLGYDVMDLYKEKLSGKNVTINGKSVPVAYSKQRFQFGTGANAKFEDIDMPYVPKHGAVVSGEGALKGEAVDLVTMKWTGREVTRDFRSFFDLLSAENMDDFFKAVHYFDIGAQSFVAADVEGNIGYFGHALVPVRDWDLQAHTPDSPLPGEGGFEWNGYLPDGKLVQAKNPAKGYIATANNDIVGTTLDNNPFNDEQYYWFLQDLGFRISRISELIEDRRGERNRKITLEDMEAIQNDTFSLEAERVVPLILDLVDALDPADSRLTPAMNDALGYLRTWTFGTPTGVESPLRKDKPADEEKAQAVATLIYFAFQDLFTRAILADDYAQYDEGVPGWQQGTKFMLYALENTETAAATAHWFDDLGTAASTESPADLILLSLQDTLDDLTERLGADMTQWQWGKLHKAEGGDVLSLATGKSIFTNGPVANDGSQYTVDVADFNGDYVQHSGAQIRFVVEMKKGAIVSRSIIPGGQADDQDSKHKGDQWAPWINNERMPYRFYDVDVEKNAESKWVYLPE